MQLLNEPKDVQDQANSTELHVTDGAIEFENVSFSYDEKREILKSISFKVEGGTSLAIVGGSGGGKTTLTRLLYRFYDVTGGSIKIDGQVRPLLSLVQIRRLIRE